MAVGRMRKDSDPILRTTIEALRARQGLMSGHELSRVLGLHPETVRNWTRNGRIPSIRLGARTVKYNPDRIAEWLAAREVM
jgi:excisionase family DNA binding protein